MNIMVFDVPAEKGGALSILHECYDEALNTKKNINWIFVVSKAELKETKNIKVLSFPWIKKSWGHRMFFDYFIANQLVKKYKVDQVLSLQNIRIPQLDCEQIVYLHQSLPFSQYKFSFKQNKLFWIYQNIISHNIINSIKKAKYVIVQTEWMKKACVEKSQVVDEKIKVIPPSTNIEVEKYFQPNQEAMSTFFFPANGSEYKNHQIILDACRELKKCNINEFKVIFTLEGHENNYVSNMYKQVQEDELPVYFDGFKTRKEVYDLYSKSVLIFPSMIETFGLPLLEAKLVGTIILASNEPFSHEVLSGYKNGYFFDAKDKKRLTELMKQIIQKKITYYENNTSVKRNTKQIISVLFEDN